MVNSKKLVVPVDPRKASKKLMDKMVIAAVELYGLPFESREEVDVARKHVKKRLSEKGTTKINGEEIGLTAVRWYNLTGNYAASKGIPLVDYVDEKGRVIVEQKVRGFRDLKKGE